MTESRAVISWEGLRRNLLWFVIPLLLGVLLAALVREPSVGLIYLNSSIDGSSAKTLNAQIDYARSHNEISAIVLILDSPGGTVADTEAVYLELLKLRKTKPVVASINSMAASGAYYLSVGSDYIFAKPTSDVGNIGVIGYLPQQPLIYEGIISTGPYKLFGAPRDTFMRQIEIAKQGFFGAVRAGRGDRIKTSTDVVLSGQIWPGSEALQFGLIDALGAQSDAIEKAAQMARISHYKTVDLADLALIPQQQPGNSFFASSADGMQLPYPKEAGVYMLYIPPMPAGKK